MKWISISRKDLGHLTHIIFHKGYKATSMKYDKGMVLSDTKIYFLTLFGFLLLILTGSSITRTER